jgi:exosome complex RNA-binding protein Rrp42 (RNase PH superfamily)
MTELLEKVYGNTMIDKEQLCIVNHEICWLLFIDVLILDELSLVQIDYIGYAIRAALINLILPKIHASKNSNTGKY